MGVRKAARLASNCGGLLEYRYPVQVEAIYLEAEVLEVGSKV